MKKVLGYGVFYLIGLGFLFCLSLRVESIDNNMSKTSNEPMYALNK